MTQLARRFAIVLLPALFLSPAVCMAAAPASFRDDAQAPQAVNRFEQLAYIIHNGCPAGLDKVCQRSRSGKLKCHCQS